MGTHFATVCKMGTLSTVHRLKLALGGKESRGKTQVRKPACSWLYIYWGAHFAGTPFRK
jgi:hypothetical protein